MLGLEEQRGVLELLKLKSSEGDTLRAEIQPSGAGGGDGPHRAGTQTSETEVPVNE